MRPPRWITSTAVTRYRSPARLFHRAAFHEELQHFALARGNLLRARLRDLARRTRGARGRQNDILVGLHCDQRQ